MIKKLLYTSAITILAITGIVVASASLFFTPKDNASALSGNDFNPGRIIDDAVFYNAGSMTSSQIQTFLNSKVPTCDTNGTAKATEKGYPNLTHAQYAKMMYDSKGQGWQVWHQPPYVCLKDRKQNTPQMEAASGLCGAIQAYTNRTAAQIISDIATACGINPQVLLVLLEKEQSLITDNWPLNNQYQKATGFDCPDSAPCDPAYAGFFYQVYYAARQFKIYQKYPNDYNYIAGRTNRIYWHPDLSRCGSSQVYIENQATAGLYIYTPYRPNQAALNNLYGTGDSCSSYGNRNFWRLFNDWFGPTTSPLISSSGLLLYGWNTGDPITAVFDIKNISKSVLNVDYIRVRAVNENGDQYLFTPTSGLSLQPGGVYKYQQSVVMDKEGTYTFTIDRKVGSTWYPTPFSDFNYSGITTLIRKIPNKPTVTTSLELSNSSVHVNEPVTATFGIKNNSAIQSVDIGLIKVEAFDANGNQYQFDSNSGVVLAPGETYSYSSTASFDKPSKLTFEIVNYNSTLGWNKDYPISDSPAISRKVSIDIKNQAVITQGLAIDNTNIREGDTTTATFKVRNFGTTPVNIGSLKVEAFDANGNQYQFGSTGDNFILAPGQEYTYTQNLVLNKKGTYNFRIVNNSPQVGWNYTLPQSDSPSTPRQIGVDVKYQADITSSLSITPTNPSAGNTLTATFKVRNFGTTPVNIGSLKVEAFDANGNQYQFGSTGDNFILAPGQEYTYTQNLVLNKKGTYNFRIVNNSPQVGWNYTLPQSQNSNIIRSQTIVVK